MSVNIRNIGIPDLKVPEQSCTDQKCPFHGNLKVRGRILTGNVVSTKQKNTVVIRRDFDYFVPKYERYERRHSSVSAHCPECIEAVEGDIVRIAECRKLSKMVSFVVIEIVKGVES